MASHPSRSVWLTVARILQIAIIATTTVLFVVGNPSYYEEFRVVCRAEPCPPGQLTVEAEQAAASIGLSVDSILLVVFGYGTLLGLAFAACAVLIVVRKPRDPLAMLISVMLATLGTATLIAGATRAALFFPGTRWLAPTLALIGNFSVVVFYFVFPNGRFVPRWAPAVLVVWLAYSVLLYYFPNAPFTPLPGSPLGRLLFYGIILGGVAAQIYRYVRVSSPVERQQTKWVVLGVVLGVGGYVGFQIASSLLADPMGADFLLTMLYFLLSHLFILVLPLSIGIAVLRYRLWNIDPIINRTLVYLLLSAATIAFYVLAVGVAANYFRNQSASFVISFLATGVVAFLFEPLRERLQRGVNRLMYGERDDPATVLTRLGQRLETVLAPESVLQMIVETLAQTLRLPYAAIAALGPGVEAHLIAARGRPQDDVVRLPLTYQAERVAELILAPRAAGETFSPADMKLISVIAHQAGIAAYTVRLNEDLRQSRQRLVTAQEEERRRLRRDLHDGVGPTLASFSQRIDAAAELVHLDPKESVRQLGELKEQVRGTVAEIRRLVYALRPPVLDEFGLVSSIREHVAPYTGPHGLRVEFEASESLPPLSAAVEVAAYRIALEAFTNMVKHAEATLCKIKIAQDGNALLLELSDNGKGISGLTRSGIGWTSMRERARDLGGDCRIENLPTGGTRVLARLPLALEPA